MAVVKGESKYSETAKFIKDNMKLVGEKEGPRYQINQEHFNEYLAGKGITKDTIKQVAEANAEFNNATVVVLNEMLVDNAKVDRATINTRTQGGGISTRMIRKMETKTPVTGEPITKYGVVSIKMNLKARMDRDLLESCSKELEDSMK